MKAMVKQIKKHKIKLIMCSIVLGFAMVKLDFFNLTSNDGKPKFYKETAKINGVKRAYYIYIPNSVDVEQKNPAVIAFHGYESDPNGLRWLTKVDPVAEKYGYIMIYPEAINKSWNVGKGFGSRNTSTDDLSFAAALPDIIRSRHPIDENRIYTMGFSNGAQMSALMLCRLSHKIAAAAMVAHTMNIPDCAPKHKTPVAIIHGEKDTLAPFEGGGKHNLMSHQDTVAFFKQVNQTQGNPEAIVTKRTVKCFADYGEGTEVDHCIASDAGHSWPGGVEFKTELFGLTNKELNASQFIFHFFKGYKGIAPLRTASTITESNEATIAEPSLEISAPFKEPAVTSAPSVKDI